MAKGDKTVYLCNSCGEDQPKWFGRCPVCGEWNTCVEYKGSLHSSPNKSRGLSSVPTGSTSLRTLALAEGQTTAIPLAEIEAGSEVRIDTHDEELNRVLGGGLVEGSLILLGGEPGIGKSTLVLQTILGMPERRVLYVSGEESASQLKMRSASASPPTRFPRCHQKATRRPLPPSFSAKRTLSKY